MTSPSTLERLESAITVTAQAMTLHNLPLPHLKRLVAERDKLVSEGDPIELARAVLAGRSTAA